MRLANESYWNSRAEIYAEQRHISDVDREVMCLSEIRQGMRMLEVGCGPGIFAEYLLRHIKAPEVTYVGVDSSQEFTEIAEKRLAKLPGRQAQILKASVTEIPFQPGSFDIAYVMTVLHHLSVEDISKALHSLRRCLKPGGQLLMVEDWAFIPQTELELSAVELRKRLMDYEGVVENHLPAAIWQALIEEAGFWIKATVWASRHFSCERYMMLEDEDSKRLVDAIRHTPVEQRKIPMVIFNCRSN